MENTVENKQRFFDAYSGQKIFRYSWNEELYTNRYLDQEKLHKYTAELKPLSAISDEDIEDLMDYFNIKMVSFLKEDVILAIKSQFLEAQNRIPYKYADYLRSRGYLIPFMDLTIEQILEYGWAVLKSK